MVIILIYLLQKKYLEIFWNQMAMKIQNNTMQQIKIGTVFLLTDPTMNSQ